MLNSRGYLHVYTSASEEHQLLFSWSAEDKRNAAAVSASAIQQTALSVAEEWMLAAEASFQGCVTACSRP